MYQTICSGVRKVLQFPIPVKKFSFAKEYTGDGYGTFYIQVLIGHPLTQVQLGLLLDTGRLFSYVYLFSALKMAQVLVRERMESIVIY